MNSCWNHIGIWGDRTCPELPSMTHCRNCPVYATAGRGLLDREGPAGYLDEWTQVLSRPDQSQAAGTESALLFRLGHEWLALSTRLFREVLEDRVVHHVPHHSDAIFRGIINIRGEIHLCVSLESLLGLEAEEDRSHQVSHIVYARMVVIEKDGETWVFRVDEVHDIHAFHLDELEDVPITINQSRAAHIKGLISWHDRHVSYLDEELLFYALQKRTI